MKKRLLSTLLALCMVLALVPTAFAADPGDGNPKELNLPNSVTWSVPTIDGGTVTNDTYKGKIQVLIFYRVNGTCAKSNRTIDAIAKADWIKDDNVQVIAVGLGESGESDAVVKSHAIAYRAEHAPDCKDIVFAYATSSNQVMWNYASSRMCGLTFERDGLTYITYAVTVIIDPSNTIRYAWMGTDGGGYFANLIAQIEGRDPDESVGEFYVSITGTRAYAYAYEVAEQVNQLRASLGLGQLVIDPTLMDVAMQRAAECAVYYSHTRPNDTDCFTLFPSRGNTARAENIAAGYTTPDAVMNGWTNSSGHYANMTNANVNAIGVGCFYINGRYYWAQCFTGGPYESSPTRKGDETDTVSFPVVKEHFSPAGDTDTISLRMGESCQLPVNSRNLGFNNYPATLSGIYGATLSTGTNLVELDSDTLTITAKATGSGTVTLRLPNGDTLPFTVQVQAVEPFTDVPDWCAGAANWAAEQGIAQGVGNNKFAPDNPCTHAEILTFLWRAAGRQKAASPSPFTVASYYQDAVDWAYETGLINHSFVSSAPCTRADAMSYIWQVFQKPSAPASGFTDVPANADYAAAVAWAVDCGVTDGMGGGLFGPDTNCNRGHIITFLHRAYVTEARLK